MLHRPVRLVLSTVLASAFLLGACGGEDESSPAVSGVDFPTDAPAPPVDDAGGSDDHSGSGSEGSDAGGDAGAAATG